jgi:hypothetical protein
VAFRFIGCDICFILFYCALLCFAQRLGGFRGYGSLIYEQIHSRPSVSHRQWLQRTAMDTTFRSVERQIRRAPSARAGQAGDQ